MWSVELIGSIDQQPHYNPAYIIGLLTTTGLQSLSVGSDFVGRPSTLIYANLADVVKVRSELDLTADQARAWMCKTLQTEQQLEVHHPHKTWLLLTDKQEGRGMVASICPRLNPLHIALKSATERERNLALLTAVFRLCLSLAKTQAVKLDEGLSNFAVSPEGQVYYLDDECYGWDDFATFSVMLGVYIRSFDWLDPAFIEELGRNLVQLLQAIFQDADCQIAIARQLSSVFMPNTEKEQLLRSLTNILLQPPESTATPPTIAVNPHPVTLKRQVSGRFIALLADIHANYPALSCVLDYLKAENITQGIVLGDIVGYGPEPKECIERLQDCAFHIIKGNHDDGAATGNTDMGFSPDAKAAIDWTLGELSSGHREWLAKLPLSLQQDGWYAVHGAPMDADYFYAYVYAMTYQDNLDYMQQHDMGLCFHGHSHMPGVFARRKHHDWHKTTQTVDLSRSQQALVCPGSVGQPRNGHTDTQFAVYDREQRRVAFMALPYDYESVVAKIRRHHLPETLALRLLTGR